ncbi:MAG: glycosyltransferase family 2 protein [Porcipelethomonas sp.]
MVIPENNISVIAVVVTYNRKELLMECLEAILKQSHPVDKVVLIDNNSNDGTYELLGEKGYIDNSRIEYAKMDENLGGAGGFHEGMKRCRDYQYDWIWIMDDDTIPNTECLEKLLEADRKISEESSDKNNCPKPSFFASSIYGPEGEFMNLPEVSNKPSPNGYAYWYKYLSQGMISISSATFVSILVRKDAVDKCGIPCKDYFIWGDDTEYTRRLTKYYGDAYFVGDSIAVHKRVGAKALDINYENNPQRLKMFHYYYRNQIINNKYYGFRIHPYVQLCKSVLMLFRGIGNSLKFRRAKAKFIGTVEGICQYKKFKRYIDSQIKE